MLEFCFLVGRFANSISTMTEKKKKKKKKQSVIQRKPYNTALWKSPPPLQHYDKKHEISYYKN